MKQLFLSFVFLAWLTPASLVCGGDSPVGTAKGRAVIVNGILRASGLPKKTKSEKKVDFCEKREERLFEGKAEIVYEEEAPLRQSADDLRREIADMYDETLVTMDVLKSRQPMKSFLELLYYLLQDKDVDSDDKRNVVIEYRERAVKIIFDKVAH